MRILLTALTLGLTAAGPTLAAESALLIGNDRYNTLDRVAPARAIDDAGQALADAGVSVVAVENADRAAMLEALRRYSQGSDQPDAQAIVLVGHFAAQGDELFYLGTDADGRGLIDGVSSGLPVSALAELLTRTPGRGLLVLGATEALPDIDLPQGVTLVKASPQRAARLVEETLARPGAQVGGGDDLVTQGFSPESFTFLRADAAPSQSTPAPRSGEDDYWRLTESRNDGAAYAAYLDRYPDGRYADEAEARIGRLQLTPDDRAAQAEEALNLTREERQDVQRDLSALGFDTRGVDGIFGSGTRGAIRGWQQDQGLAPTGYLTAEQISQLERQGNERREAQRAEDEALWADMGQDRSEAELENYLERFPGGFHADEASRILTELRNQQAADAGATERERQIWRATRDENSVDGYRRYITAFPDGEFVDDARAAIARLQGQSEPQPQPQGQPQQLPPLDSAGAQEEAALGLTPVTRRAVETRLAQLGYEPGAVDGEFDDRTRSALRSYQQSAGLPQTGYVNQITAVRLLADTLRDVLR